ncbi:O-antigen ligase family protein [Dermatobacter hominis]|uniref:O-antigen ligase family protein n=1 Tax=Dermatobacter hominis TaxID=2884263 RepID=UPI001D101AE1|nr:O-antigen ligase [Dermatobacter hominis]UDY37712.1 O-antigen ligase family protein [Dermatobacter hominis]
MQTLDRPPTLPGGPSPRRGRGAVAAVVASLLALPVLVLLVVSKWGVLIAAVAAVAALICLWALRRGFALIEVVAFLIHFDGLGAGQIRMGRIVAGLVAVVIVYKLIAEKWRPPAIPTRHWLPVLMLTVYAVASGFWSDEAGGWLLAMCLLGLALVYFAISGMLVDSHDKIEQFLRAFWVGGLFGAGAGVLALFLGTRSVGFGADPNFFGMISAAMIPLTVYYRRNATSIAARRWYTVAVVFVLAGAAGAGSRSGLIGGAIVIVATIVSRPGLSTVRRMRVGVGALVLAGMAFLIGFVANPANLQRGFADRGAGRLDFWAVTVDLIGDRPLLGHGFGQLKTKIVPSMTTTPGVQELADTREDVSSHNTWLDIAGDLGLVGLLIWISIFLIAMLGFLRPRWAQTKELSGTLFIMMLPVLSSSMFLPLLNNKLAWCLIGLAAALQVPSKKTRWRGFVQPTDVRQLTTGEKDTLLPAELDPPPTYEQKVWQAPDLARWDVRVSRRFRYWIVAGAFGGMVLGALVMSSFPVRYVAAGEIVLPELAETRGNNRVVLSGTQMQVINSLATSGAYAVELQRLAGLEMSVEEVRDAVSVDRRQFGAYMRIQFRVNDAAVAEGALPYIVPALDNVVAESRAAALDRVADELRPVYPGEQRFDTSPLFLPAYPEPSIAVQSPKVAWAGFIGALTGALAAAGLVLLQQRRPRVNNDDDLLAAIGMGVWTHVGRSGRRYAATGAQYAQVATMAAEFVGREDEPRRIVVGTPRPDPAARSLAAGLAAAIAAEDRRVVLIDAQVDSPKLTRRLSGPLRSGLLQVLDGAAIEPLLRRVNRWRLPSSVRRALKDHGSRLRFLPLGRRSRGQHPVIRPELFDRFGPDVTLVVLAPSLTSDVPVGALLAWADAALLTLVEGRTVTFDAEDAAAPIRTFSAGPSGVVMMDV